MASQFTIVRNYQTLNGGHNLQPIVGPHSLQASIPVDYSRVVGTTHAQTGRPTNAILFPQTVSDDVPRGSARGNLAETGAFGSGYAPFIPSKDGQLQKEMQLSLPRDRFFGDRQTLLGKLDKLRRDADANGQVGALDDLQQQAYDFLLGGGVARALDLSQEDPAVLSKYDTSEYATKGLWNSVSRGKAGYKTTNSWVALNVAALGFTNAAPSDAICRSSVFESGFISLLGLYGHRVGLGNN